MDFHRVAGRVLTAPMDSVYTPPERDPGLPCGPCEHGRSATRRLPWVARAPPAGAGDAGSRRLVRRRHGRRDVHALGVPHPAAAGAGRRRACPVPPAPRRRHPHAAVDARGDAGERRVLVRVRAALRRPHLLAPPQPQPLRAVVPAGRRHPRSRRHAPDGRRGCPRASRVPVRLRAPRDRRPPERGPPRAVPRRRRFRSRRHAAGARRVRVPLDGRPVAATRTGRSTSSTRARRSSTCPSPSPTT